MSSDEKIDRFRTELSGDEEIEMTFRRLRQEGHSRLEAIRLILDVLDVSLTEAKTLLLTNDTWDEARAAADQEPDSSDPDAPDDPIPPAPA